MRFILTVFVLAFSAIVCIVEIPGMWRNKEYKELVAFSVILCCGLVLAILKIFNINIPNPADFIKFLYAPVVDLMKGALE